jgi:alpha-L-fucosidase
MSKRKLMLVFSLLIMTLAMSLLSSPAVDKDKEAARLKWWREARFGMFVHWGPVSLKGTEIGWSRGQEVPTAEYDQLYKNFNPVKFDAEAWASIAKAAGMKYLVLTSKHHDGFCLWDTKQTDYSITHTPFKRDILRELAEACKKQGLVFCTYYSILDWYHPDYPLGSPFNHDGKLGSLNSVRPSGGKKPISGLLILTKEP